jgi:HK97 family phage prohead protease
MTIEIRALAGPGDIDSTDDGVIFGLAIPYNRETIIGDLKDNGFREKIAPGSCSKSLREADIVALWNHNSSQPLGRTSAGNLTLKNTTRGVEPELAKSDTSYGQDLSILVRDKIVRGWSFGFEVIRDTWTDDDGNASDQWSGTNRVIQEMRLAEVSPCTFPAYEMTNISARDAASAAREGRGEKREATAPGGDQGDEKVTPVEEARLAVKAAKEALRAAKESAGEDDTRKKLTASSAKRIAQISVILGQALELFGKADVDDLPKEAQDAIALISSADEHAGHIMKKEKLTAADVIDTETDRKADKTSAEKRDAKPDKTTSTEPPTEDALRKIHMDACRREIDLGL